MSEQKSLKIFHPSFSLYDLLKSFSILHLYFLYCKKWSYIHDLFMPSCCQTFCHMDLLSLATDVRDR